ncbi:MAG: leucyl aminopeptidase family protein [Caulobacteraceae bacterium]
MPKSIDRADDPGLDASGATPVDLVQGAGWEAFAAAQDAGLEALAGADGFTGQAGRLLKVPGPDGRMARVVFGLGEGAGPAAMAIRALAAALPVGDYRIAAAPEGLDPAAIALAWALGAYRFDRYKQDRGEAAPRLIPPAGADMSGARGLAHACALARDMINTPANDMGPRQIETIAREIAEAHGATIAVTVGDALIEAGYPAVHAVGRAAAPEHAPRMLAIAWGEVGHPLIALVGKGVTFDSGGLDIKPSAGMRLMKKDMGGAAHALALARMIMAARLPVRLAVLIPAVENAIGGDAMRPGDVLASRSGLSIEVGNTDAEGRLILADALSRAAELSPALTIDLATLTGAARVALGPRVVPFYTADDALAGELAGAAADLDDPLWRMPLWQGYAGALASDVADIKNDPDPWAQAGSIAAALFLQRFAPKGAWVHFDIFAWNPHARPGWPVGAEVQAIRALYAVPKARYR